MLVIGKLAPSMAFCSHGKLLFILIYAVSDIVVVASLLQWNIMDYAQYCNGLSCD